MTVPCASVSRMRGRVGGLRGVGAAVKKTCLTWTGDVEKPRERRQQRHATHIRGSGIYARHWPRLQMSMRPGIMEMCGKR
jgi:hypothetical protein